MINRYHGLDNLISGVAPLGHLGRHVSKVSTVGNHRFSIDVPALHQRHHAIKVFANGITAADQGQLFLVEIRITEGNVCFDYTHQNIATAMPHQIEPSLHSTRAPCGIKHHI